MAAHKTRCMTSSTLVRELYWGYGGGAMECFSGAVIGARPSLQPHPSCSSDGINEARLDQNRAPRHHR